MAEALDGAVVEVRMGQDELRLPREGLGVDGEPVVLRRHLDVAGLQVVHRVVRAAVAELELERPGPAGQAEDLVAEADAEDGDARLHDPPRRLDGVGAGLRVAGAVREEHAVRLHGQRVFAGTTVTSQPEAASMRTMLRFMPKS